jgi:Uma2 family endonuclease
MVIAKSETASRPRMTEDEFMRLPDDGKYELVNGEARKVPAGHEHDIMAANIICLLKPSAKGRGYLASSQAGFRMKDGNIRSPDVSFTSKSRLPDGKPGKGFGDFAPDLCIEIISPSEEGQDMEDKVREYFDAGAVQVWQLFPEAQQARDFTSATESTDFAPTHEIAGGDVLPSLRCRVSDLFALE